MKPNKFAAIKYEDRVLIRDAKNRIHRALVTHFEGLLFKALVKIWDIKFSFKLWMKNMQETLLQQFMEKVKMTSIIHGQANVYMKKFQILCNSTAN